MQCQCISKIVIYNTVFNATPFTCFVNTKRVEDFNAWLTGEEGTKTKSKNVARDAHRYLQKGTSTGKSENSLWICSIFRIMWVKFQVSFNTFYGFKRQAIIRWPINGIGKYTHPGSQLCLHHCWCSAAHLFSIISLIRRLSHRLSYLTFRTISWSWNSSTNYFMARALHVRSES